MANKVITDESNLMGIAAAIRVKNSQSTTYKPSEMAQAIMDLSNTVNPAGAINISSNGLYDVMSKAQAAVNVPTFGSSDSGKVISGTSLIPQTSLVVSSNSTYDTTFNDSVVVDVQPSLTSLTASVNSVYSVPDGFDGFSGVVVNVPAGGGTPVLESLEVSSNGSYTPSSGVDGFSMVTVSVSAGTNDGDATLSSGGQMLSGVTAYARGSKYTGTIETYIGSVNSSSGTIGKYPVYSGAYFFAPSTESQVVSISGMAVLSDIRIGSYVLPPITPVSAVLSDILISSNGSYAASAYSADGFANVVVDVPTGLDLIVLSDVEFTSNGSFSVPPGVDGYSNVTVNVAPPELSTLAVSSNGVYSVPSDVYGYSEVTVDVSLPRGVLEVSANGEYAVTSDIYGYSIVTVSVEGTILSDITISSNGVYSAESGIGGYSNITVEVPMPSGSISISSNGTVDVSAFANAVVDVQFATGSSTFTSNGVYTASDYGLDGFSGVTVSIPLASISVAQNGVYSASDYGAAGFSVVEVSIPSAQLISSTITSNGVYNATPADGFSQVTVSLASYTGSYAITPSTSEIVVPVSGLLMSSDLTIASTSDYVLGSVSLSSNGTYAATDKGVDGFSQVVVSVPILLSDITVSSNGNYSAPQGYDGLGNVVVDVTPSLSDITISSNGSYSAVGIDGYSNITVSVQPKLTSTTISSNGSYYVPSPYDGFSKVTVDVAPLVSYESPCGQVPMSMFLYADFLKSVDLPSCTTIGITAFRQCSNLTSISLPECTQVMDEAFYGCTKLKAIDLPKCSTISQAAFGGCMILSVARFSVRTGFGVNAFAACTALSDIYLYSGASISPITDTALLNTPFRHNDSAYARVHVPSALINDYKVANNWSEYSNCFVAL